MICAGCEVDMRGLTELFLQVSEVSSEYNSEIGDYVTIHETTMSFCSSACLRRWY